jgi:hypothetical protein
VLDDAAAVRHHRLVGDRAYGREVVREEDLGHAGFLPQVGDPALSTGATH